MSGSPFKKKVIKRSMHTARRNATELDETMNYYSWEGRRTVSDKTRLLATSSAATVL